VALLGPAATPDALQAALADLLDGGAFKAAAMEMAAEIAAMPGDDEVAVAIETHAAASRSG
jgi:hypothetical protein